MADLPPSYSTLTAPHMETARVCVITLNESDKIRLIATQPELVQAVRQAIHSGWGKIQRERDYAGTHEFKLDGYPWHGDGKQSVMCRRLLTHLLRSMAAHGWNLIQAVDMSKKQMDKDALFFELGSIQHEKEYEGSIEFKLSGNPFYSDWRGAVYARMLLAQILANLRSQGYKLYSSADISIGADGMDLDSWVFRRVGPAWS
ncbi:hypothetical protein MVEG_08435 [Podila verticillata NRRL 6337]|nr:hypothetical protein MVEG_08435 [Podila verticillata NRRL 6337]